MTANGADAPGAGIDGVTPAASELNSCLLVLRDIENTYGATRAVDHLTLGVAASSVHAVVGESTSAAAPASTSAAAPASTSPATASTPAAPSTAATSAAATASGPTGGNGSKVIVLIPKQTSDPFFTNAELEPKRPLLHLATRSTTSGPQPLTRRARSARSRTRFSPSPPLSRSQAMTPTLWHPL